MTIFRTAARGDFSLRAGAKLLFDPAFPPGYEEHGHFCVDSDGQALLRIKERYRGTEAEFLDHGTTLVGPLDQHGRWPGVYADPDVVNVRFDLDKYEIVLYTSDFVVLPGLYVRHEQPLTSPELRLSDLPGPVPFWSGDLVRLVAPKVAAWKGLDERPRLLHVGFVGPRSGSHRFFYTVYETEEERQERRTSDPRSIPKGRKRLHVQVDDISLHQRGNVWALYNDPSKLKFASDQEEMLFWMQEGIRRMPKSKQELPTAYATPERALEKGEELLLYRAGDDYQDELFVGYKLHECFAQHRERVRELTKRFFAYNRHKERSMAEAS